MYNFSEKISSVKPRSSDDGVALKTVVDNRPESSVQRKLIQLATAQLEGDVKPEEEEKPLPAGSSAQGKFETAQLEDTPPVKEEEEVPPVTAKFESVAIQREVNPVAETKPNNTGMPDSLKSGVESLSGLSMDHVKVHYGSDKPAQLNALAYAQGSEIHVAPGQERHLPHEAWHVVQQMQGRVEPTTQINDVAVNDNPALESEADVMGDKAMRL